MAAETTTIAIDAASDSMCICLNTSHGPQVIPDSTGDRLIPCLVSTKDSALYIGKHDANNDEEAVTVFRNIKQVIGRNNYEDKLSADVKEWDLPFKLVKNYDRLYCHIAGLPTSAVEIAALPLRHARYLAGTMRPDMHIDVTGCILTVPTYYTLGQIQATKDAARMAGFTVHKIIHAPVAVAVEALHGRDEEGCFVVCTASDGRIDWAVVALLIDGGSGGTGKRIFTVVDSGGDKHLQDADIVQARLDKVTATGQATSCTQPRSSSRNVLGGFGFRLQEDCSTPLLDGVVLARGGAACPDARHLADLIAKLFPTIPVWPADTPEQSPARGAARCIGGDDSSVTICHGLSRSIGIYLINHSPEGGGAGGGTMVFILGKNEALPTSFAQMVTATAPNNKTTFALFEGEHDTPLENIHLGTFSVAVPKDEIFFIQVMVTAQMDVVVTAEYVGGPALVVHRTEKLLSEKQIAQGRVMTEMRYKSRGTRLETATKKNPRVTRSRFGSK